MVFFGVLWACLFGSSYKNRWLVVQEWEGRMNVGMSNSVTTAIRGSVRDMAIGKTKTTEKADRATVEQVTNGDFMKCGT